jgi:hypothetical protein
MGVKPSLRDCSAQSKNIRKNYVCSLKKIDIFIMELSSQAKETIIKLKKFSNVIKLIINAIYKRNYNFVCMRKNSLHNLPNRIGNIGPCSI